ncbi:MAG: ABC transporter substrate-binding protein [Puniceicoccales bacterium]|nr:ABC transporter substrate-binding protein [Puniceicoccales bacterium]
MLWGESKFFANISKGDFLSPSVEKREARQSFDFIASQESFLPLKNLADRANQGNVSPQKISKQKNASAQSRGNKSREIKILMLLWRGETDAERGFLAELEALNYHATTTIVNVEGSLKQLKKILYTELNPKNYDYIYTFGTLTSLVAAEWANDSPLIFNAVSHPVATGLITHNEGHNGGNLSGVGTSAPMELQLENMKHILGDLKHLTVLVNPKEQNCLQSFEALELAAKEKSITLERVDISDEDAIATQLTKLGEGKPNGAIYVTSSSFFSENARAIFDHGRSQKIAMVAEQMDMIPYGALMGTGPSYESSGKMAAKILDMNYDANIILSAIPIQWPEFFCFINKNTAKILSLSPRDTPFKVLWIEDKAFLEEEHP